MPNSTFISNLAPCSFNLYFCSLTAECSFPLTKVANPELALKCYLAFVGINEGLAFLCLRPNFLIS